MKKSLIITLIVIILFTITYSFADTEFQEITPISSIIQKVEAYINTNLKLKIDGNEYIDHSKSNEQLPLLIYKDRTYVPLRSIAELLGNEVIWNEEDKIVNIKKEPIIIDYRLVGRWIETNDKMTMELTKDGKLFSNGSLYATYEVIGKNTIQTTNIETGDVTKVEFKFETDKLIWGTNFTEYKVYEKNELRPDLIEGQIMDIKKDGDYVYALISGKGTSYKEVKAIINNETEIMNQIDNSLINMEDLEVGMEVNLYYGPQVTMSIPPQSPARKIIVKKDLSYHLEEKIINIENKNIVIHYPQMKDYPGELLMDYMNQSLEKIPLMFLRSGTYDSIYMDYQIKTINNDLLSVVFIGRAKVGSRDINIKRSINLDIESTNEINFENLIKDREALIKILDQIAKEKNLVDYVEAEGIFVYFEDSKIIFYYMPLDDSATEFIEIPVESDRIEHLINDDFGERPAS